MCGEGIDGGANGGRAGHGCGSGGDGNGCGVFGGNGSNCGGGGNGGDGGGDNGNGGDDGGDNGNGGDAGGDNGGSGDAGGEALSAHRTAAITLWCADLPICSASGAQEVAHAAARAIENPTCQPDIAADEITAVAVDFKDSA